jgi:glucokinase
MVGPVLPEQPPTQWNACAADLTVRGLCLVTVYFWLIVCVGLFLTIVLPRQCFPGISQAVLVNDFVAVGLGVAVLPPSQLQTLRPGIPQQRAPKVRSLGVFSKRPLDLNNRVLAELQACVGAGTGLGEVFMTWQPMPGSTEGAHVAWASEGGMTPFVALSQRDWAFREWLVSRGMDPHVSPTIESLVSGPGLANAYRFLMEKENVCFIRIFCRIRMFSSVNLRDNQAPELEGADGDDALQVKVAAAAAAGHSAARQAVDWLLQTWAAECRNIALRYVRRAANFVPLTPVSFFGPQNATSGGALCCRRPGSKACSSHNRGFSPCSLFGD